MSTGTNRKNNLSLTSTLKLHKCVYCKVNYEHFTMDQIMQVKMLITVIMISELLQQTLVKPGNTFPC